MNTWHRQTNSSTRQAAMKSLLDLSTTPRVLHFGPLQLALEMIGKLNGTSEQHSAQVKGSNLFIVYPVQAVVFWAPSDWVFCTQLLLATSSSLIGIYIKGRHASLSSELILCFSAPRKIAISVTLEIMLLCSALFTCIHMYWWLKLIHMLVSTVQ